MSRHEKTLFGAGCFWGVQASFDSLRGVVNTVVGYAGGTTGNPTYREVCSGRTGHAEVVLVEFDPKIISFDELVRHFFEIHDPTTLNRQGPDIGSQYRSLIMYFNEEQRRSAVEIMEDLQNRRIFDRKIVTLIQPAGEFYRAEEYHQKYIEKTGGAICGL